LQTKLLTLMYVVFLGFPAVSSGSCEVPSSTDLRNFFKNEANWTEVESPKSNVIAAKSVIQFRINFSEPMKSRVYRGGQIMGQIQQVCISDDESGIFIQAKGHKINLYQTEVGMVSELKFLGTHTFYYLPDNHVQERISQVQ